MMHERERRKCFCFQKRYYVSYRGDIQLIYSNLPSYQSIFAHFRHIFPLANVVRIICTLKADVPSKKKLVPSFIAGIVVPAIYILHRGNFSDLWVELQIAFPSLAFYLYFLFSLPLFLFLTSFKDISANAVSQLFSVLTIP